MRDFNLSLGTEKKPKYQKVSEAIRNAITAGHMTAGEKLPATRALARHLKLHRHTIMIAFDELIAEGWITSLKRQAYIVSEHAPRLNPGSQSSNAAKKRRPWRMVRTVDERMAWKPLPPAQFMFQNG